MRRNIAFITRNTFSSSRKILANESRGIQLVHTRQINNGEVAEERSHLFSLEQKRQTDAVGRIEKIEVNFVGIPEDKTFIMNRNLSTPYDCARHMSAMHMEKSALALLDGRTLWDMHRPLLDSCKLELLHFMVPDPLQVNRAFWRTCSFLLGAAVAKAFKDDYQIFLHSFPSPNVRSGSFVYDAEVRGLKDWKPEPHELRALSAEVVKCARAGPRLERLTVDPQLAQLMFQHDPHKIKQIPDIAAKNNGLVTLYRAGTHVDISKGPMVASLGMVARATVAAVHRLEGENCTLYRFQGVALPHGFTLNHSAYRILEERAAKPNPARSPFEPFTSDIEESTASRAVA